MKKSILYSILIVNFVAYVSFYFVFTERIIQFTAISLLLSALFIFLIIIIKNSVLSKSSLSLMLILGLLFRLTLIPIEPIASDDVYRYLWDGKVQAHGTNPYAYAPNDSALTHLNSEQLPSKVNFPHLKTIYPPYSQWIFLLAYLIAGESIWGIKLLLFLSEILTILFIYLTLKNFNLNEKYVLVYALSPLPILQFFIDAHVDGVGITLLAMFIYFLSAKKYFMSYLAFGLSIVSKIITIIIFPFLLKGKKLKELIHILIVTVVTMALVYLPYSFSGSPFEALFIFAEKWYSNGAIFTLFQKIFEDNFLSRIFSMILFIVGYAWIYFSDKELKDKIYLAFVLFFIFSPVVHPWYITWIAFLTSINFRWSGIIFISTISVSNIYAYNYILNQKWQMNEWILILEYLPVIIFLILEEIKINHELS